MPGHVYIVNRKARDVKKAAASLILIVACTSGTTQTAQPKAVPSWQPSQTSLHSVVGLDAPRVTKTPSRRSSAPKRAARSRPSPTAAAPVLLPSPWRSLAECESGGNPRSVSKPYNSAGDRYWGLYQFTLTSWRGVGGTGLPIDASPAEQTMRARMLQRRQGWGAWPGCARRLGLLR